MIMKKILIFFFILFFIGCYRKITIEKIHNIQPFSSKLSQWEIMCSGYPYQKGKSFGQVQADAMRNIGFIVDGTPLPSKKLINDWCSNFEQFQKSFTYKPCYDVN